MSKQNKKNNDVERLFEALDTAAEIRGRLRDNPEILEEMSGNLQELEDKIIEVQAELTDLNTKKATVGNQIALIKGTTAKKSKKGGGGTGRGKAKLAAIWINSQGINSTITPADLKIPESEGGPEMIGGYPGTWLGKQVENGYLEKIGQGNYKVIKEFPV